VYELIACSTKCALSLLATSCVGMQRQLNYLQPEGCFSIWTNGKCNLWLTAFAANVFIQIHGHSKQTLV